MEKTTENVTFDYAAIKRQYEEHLFKCKQISEEVQQWGKKIAPELKFLKVGS